MIIFAQFLNNPCPPQHTGLCTVDKQSVWDIIQYEYSFGSNNLYMLYVLSVFG